MSDLVKVYFVVSNHNHRSGQINFSLGDNMARLPRGARRVYGTGHYNRGIVMSRLKKCQVGEWFPEQHKARKSREREDSKFRKMLHARYLRSIKQTKSK